MIKILLTTTFFCLNLLANQIELSGTVISDNEKIITSRNMGYIKEVYVNEGSNVKKGDILYEIDASNIDSNKKEILLNLEILQNQNVPRGTSNDFVSIMTPSGKRMKIPSSSLNQALSKGARRI